MVIPLKISRTIKQIATKPIRLEMKEFLKINPEKIALFVAILIIVPVPFSAGLAAGYAPFIQAIPGAILMAIGSILSLNFVYFLFFAGQIIIYPLLAYLVASLFYKIIFVLSKGHNVMAWIFISAVICWLIIINILLKGGKIWC